MGRHVDKLERSIDGVIPSTMRRAAQLADAQEARDTRAARPALSPDQLAATSLQIRLESAAQEARFHAHFANRNRVYLRGQGRVRGNNWVTVFAKANAARRALRRELAAVRARIDAASDQTFHALAAE